jgi:hypothetical protein
MPTEFEDAASETQRLQNCINDLVSVLALPAMWSGHDAAQVVSRLLDALVRMLRLELAYVRVTDAIDGSPVEWHGWQTIKISQSSQMKSVRHFAGV